MNTLRLDAHEAACTLDVRGMNCIMRVVWCVSLPAVPPNHSDQAWILIGVISVSPVKLYQRQVSVLGGNPFSLQGYT